MRISELDFKQAFIMEQLHQLDFTATEGLSYEELNRKLAMARR
ncbi:hypothetical protein [Thalassobacillus cyri]|nr:hypothetical protein [Thalassobacillus cyri]